LTLPLDPQVQTLLDQFRDLGGPELAEVEPAQAREMIAMMAQLGPPPLQVAAVDDHWVPVQGGEILVRTYRTSTDASLPTVVFFHGGGWVIGSVDISDASCRQLASLSGCLVCSVDYRLAPEHKFPTAVDDAFAATVWIAEHAHELGGDPSRLAVAGDSAGGNLSTVVSLLARDNGGPKIAYQALIYPAVDFVQEWPSYERNGDGYFLTRRDMEWFRDHYLSSVADRSDWRASPLGAKSLAGLPPALIIAAEFDPLVDQDLAYAEALERAGVPVTLRQYDGVIHGFWSMEGVIDKGGEAMNEVVASLAETLGARQAAVG
jgi:acetyl esterase